MEAPDKTKADPARCPQCGALLLAGSPGGQCPRCLLGLAEKVDDVIASDPVSRGQRHIVQLCEDDYLRQGYTIKRTYNIDR